jgi:N,N'-diacetyllegionaminate synthase
MGKTKPSWLAGSNRSSPYIIAEVGVNHNGDLGQALRLAEVARQAGANCVKFQAFTAEGLAVRSAPKATYQESCGSSGESQYDMLCRYELTEDDFVELKQCCDKLNIDFMVTPFSKDWVQILHELGVNTIKIGSGNLHSPLLLKATGKTGLPVVLSSGMSDIDDLEWAVNTLYDNGTRDLAILHCVSLYPTPLAQANLRAMQTIVDSFDVPVGYSDHTEDLITGALAVMAGAAMLEKHFTLDKGADGPDHAMSLSPDELAEYIRLARQAASSLGDGRKEVLAEEEQVKAAVQMSVVAKDTIQAGSTINETMLEEKRPATGIPAEDIYDVVGQIAKVDIEPNQILKWNMLKTPITPSASREHEQTVSSP